MFIWRNLDYLKSEKVNPDLGGLFRGSFYDGGR